MDGTLAAIFLIASLTDMALTDCPTGCLAQSDAISRLSFQAAKVEFQEDIIGDEIYVGYDFGTSYGPFQLGGLEKGAVKEITSKVLHEQISGFFTGERK